MLGRLIEELVMKTAARLVIFDPNSDFIRLPQPAPSAWTHPSLSEWLYPGEVHERFSSSWKNASLAVASNRNLEHAHRLVLDWGALTLLEMAAFLGIAPRDEPDLHWCLIAARQASTQSWTDPKEATYDFDHFLSRAEQLANFIVKGKAPQLMRDNPLAQSVRASISPKAALDFRARASALLDYEIWRSKGDGESDIRALVSSDTSPRVLVVDLLSLARTEEKTGITSALLGRLWDIRRAQHWEATRDLDRPDTRVPTFVMIDEAHNLAPSDRSTPAIGALSAEIARIAAEGRKFGLFLILATQRPRKLDPNVLSECDNLIHMRMSSQSDIAYAVQSLGLDSHSRFNAARSFTTGELVVGGRLASSKKVLHVSPRRTVQGGRGISSTYWTSPEGGPPK
jgi:hypothetical protein